MFVYEILFKSLNKDTNIIPIYFSPDLTNFWESQWLMTRHECNFLTETKYMNDVRTESFIILCNLQLL